VQSRAAHGNKDCEVRVFGISNYGVFILAGIMLNLTPGIDTIYILTKSISGGRRHGIASALGISTGCLVHTVLAALGLSLILLSSAELFFAVKVAGAAYLVFMGVRAILNKKALTPAKEGETPTKLRKVYVQGIITNVLNPKVALFFLAFLPQFVDPNSFYGPVPFLILGLTFVATGTIWCLVIAQGASYFHRLLSRNTRVAKVTNLLAGSIYILLGLSIFNTHVDA
jgi:threonine/homoserine/homoserine lactone efflux protein